MLNNMGSDEMELIELVDELYERILRVRELGYCVCQEIDRKLAELGLVEYVECGGYVHVCCTELSDYVVSV